MAPKANRTEAFLSEHPRAVDVAVTAVVVLVHVLSFQVDDAGYRQLDSLGVALSLTPALLTLIRRHRPVLSLGIATILAMAYWVMNYPGSGAIWALAVLIYSTALYAPERRQSARTLPIFLMTVLTVLVSGYLAPTEDDVSVGVILTTLAMLQFAWTAGDMIRNRRTRIQQLEAEMADAEAEQSRTTEAAVTEERNRIARELHDVVAHAMSVMIVQAEGARRLVGKDDDAVVEALRAIESTGRTNLNDIRGIVGVLRVDGTPYAPTPDLSSIDELIDQCRDAGLDVSITVEGTERPLPAMIELSCYRVVQESLTNVRKHGGPHATATVTLSYAEDSISLHISDTGHGAGANRPETPGHGLLGMRERVEAFGGTISSGPRAGGGYVVTATLPIAATTVVTS